MSRGVLKASRELVDSATETDMVQANQALEQFGRAPGGSLCMAMVYLGIHAEGFRRGLILGTLATILVSLGLRVLL